VLFDSASCIKRYTSVTEILTEFYDLRLQYYVKRKEYMEGMLSAESLKLANQARFICEKIDGRIAIGKDAFVFLLFLAFMYKCSIYVHSVRIVEEVHLCHYVAIVLFFHN